MDCSQALALSQRENDVIEWLRDQRHYSLTYQHTEETQKDADWGPP